MKYKNWDSIINPGLERTRKKKKRSIFEEEIDKAIGMDDKSQEEAGIGNVEEVPLSKEADVVLNIAPVDNTVAENDNLEGNESPRQRRWAEITRPEEENFSYSMDMTEKEKEAFREKRKKLRGVMDELLSWKETRK